MILCILFLGQHFDTCSHAILYFSEFPLEKPRHVCLLPDGSFQNRSRHTCLQMKGEFCSRWNFF